MQLGMVGLGRMGGNLVRRLARQGHECIVFDENPAAVASLAEEPVQGGADLADLVRRLARPRAVWVMLPAGEITEKTVAHLGTLLEPGDTIIDGGNTFFQDDVRRAGDMKAKGVHYLDCGTSGGVWGLERGYCLMIGGAKEAVERAIDSRAPLRAIAAATTVNVSRDGLTATVGLHGKRANRKGFLARIFEFGAKAHEILPRGEGKRTKRMRARLGGKLPFEKPRILVTKDGRFLGKRVRHPGMAARPFFFNTAKALRPQIAAAIKAAIIRALEKSG